jgi:peroxiredoxin
MSTDRKSSTTKDIRIEEARLALRNVRAVLYAALFFETCSEEQCDLKTAVKQLEGIAAELDGLTTANKAEFRAFVLSEAAAHPVPAVSKEIAELIDTLLAED